jgi:hypothetical protein
MGGLTLGDLRSNSPVKERDRTADVVVSVLYQPRETLVCCTLAAKGIGAYGMIRSAGEWVRSGELEKYQYVVQGTMKNRYVLDENGQIVREELRGIPKRRLKSNINQERNYIVTEWDEDSINTQVAMIWRLANYAPLAAVVHSAGKSLQAWWHVRGVSQDLIERFFQYACRLGADPSKWSVNGLVRLPGGWRNEIKNGRHIQGRQEIIYFDTEAMR